MIFVGIWMDMVGVVFPFFLGVRCGNALKQVKGTDGF